MSLAVIGKGASYEFRWRSWALLRDVVVANLDEAALPAFCSLGDAMVKGTISVNADRLAADIAQIRQWLVGRSFDELVIGPRTASLVHLTDAVKGHRQLTLTEIDRIRPIANSPDLADYFCTMLDSLARVSSHPNDDDTIEVVDG